ncbi:MAG: putative quinol monooxygenase [Acetobacteraceae bacterium]
MDGLVILARFRIAPGRRQEFLDLVGRNAAASLADEAGCRRFDVLTEAGGAAGDVVLYEIYDSPLAFDAHLASPHFSRFRAATEEMVLSSSVERLKLRETIDAA